MRRTQSAISMLLQEMRFLSQTSLPGSQSAPISSRLASSSPSPSPSPSVDDPSPSKTKRKRGIRPDFAALWDRLPTARLHRPRTQYERDLVASAPPWTGSGPGAQVGRIVSAQLPRPVLVWTEQGLVMHRGRAFRGRTIPVRPVHLEVNYRLGTCVVLHPAWSFVANYPSVLPFVRDTTLY